MMMNAYRINNFLSQLSQNREKSKQLQSQDVSVFEGLDLTEEEQQSILTCNATKLYEAGVHPLLMMQLSIFLEKDIKQLYSEGM